MTHKKSIHGTDSSSSGIFLPIFKIILMNFLISLYFNMSPIGTEIASS